jgi:hypothetical protein
MIKLKILNFIIRIIINLCLKETINKVNQIIYKDNLFNMMIKIQFKIRKFHILIFYPSL